MSSLSVKFAAVLQLLFSVKKEFRVIVFEKYIKLNRWVPRFSA